MLQETVPDTFTASQLYRRPLNKSGQAIDIVATVRCFENAATRQTGSRSSRSIA
jgi:hypothetical protein